MAPIPSGGWEGAPRGGYAAGMPFDSISPRDVGANAPAILAVQNASKALGVFRPPERAGLWLSCPGPRAESRTTDPACNAAGRISVLSSRSATVLFDAGAVALGFDELFLQGARSRAVLAAGFFLLVLHFELGGGSQRLQSIAEFHSGDMAVLRLGALPLAADLHAAGEVTQHDGGRGFVDLLAARSGAANEGLFQILLVDMETLHAGAQSTVIGKFGHGRRMNAVAGMSNREWDGASGRSCVLSG